MEGRRSRDRSSSSRLRRYGRTLVAGVVSCTLAVFGTIAFAAIGSSARADDVPFANGQAVAQGSVLRIAPGVGSLALATTTGTSLAHIQNQLAEAQAQAADLGLIGSSLTAQGCDGSPGAVQPSQLPQPLIVDNRSGPASASKDEAPVAGSSLGGGRKEATADQTPAAHADVTEVGSTVGSTVTVSNGRSDAEARVDPGKARFADATVSVDIDIAGVVQLHGAQWHALHRTGEGATQVGTFSVASASAGDVPLPIDQMAPLQTAINQALALTGVTVTLPTVQHITSPNDFIQVTPLEIKLDQTPLGKATLGPVLNAVRAQREQILTQLYAISCQLEGAGLVGDIGVDIVSGTGFMIIDIGGVTASSEQIDYTDPFGTVTPMPISSPGAPGSTSLSPAAPAIATAPATGPASGATTTATARPIASTGPLESLCETISPAKRPACSLGMGAPLALTAIAVTAAVAYLDWRHQRRALAASQEAAA